MTSQDTESPADAEITQSKQPSRDNEVYESLYNLVYWMDGDGEKLDGELRSLEQQHGQAVYAELIYLLTHLRMPAAEACEHWRAVLAHRDSMQERLGSALDLRVALVSYFVEVQRKIHNPKIIEMRAFTQDRAAAYRDELTGLRNYRYFGECLEHEIMSSRQHSTPVSLVMIDIDDFRDYNEAQGHEAGNAALVLIAELLNQALRRVDVLVRYGGEVFSLILPFTPKSGARLVAERAREIVQRQFSKNGSPGLTVSMGIATFPADAASPGELIRHADRAMYTAKARGKNQVHLHDRDRRSFRRIDATLHGRFRTICDERHELTTLKLSEGGMLFLSDRGLPRGALAEIDLTLPGSEIDVCLTGRVVQSVSGPAGDHETAIRIVEGTTGDRRLLFEYLRSLTDPDADSTPS